jgi:ABC-2 type transport system ATP-binding protein
MSKHEPLIVATGLSRDYALPRPANTWRERLLHLVRPRTEIKHSVIDLDFQIHAGECVGLIGPNGAGKSTTIKMLTGILRPTHGELRVNDYQPYRDRLRYVREIGVIFGQRSQLWPDMSVLNSYRMLKTMYDVPEKKFQDTLSLFADRMGIAEFWHKPSGTLSLGQRMLCEITSAFLHGPKVVFLDEPTIGLDIEVKARIRALIKMLNEELGTTILITSHDVDDIEKLCSRILLIHEGRKVFDGEIELFRSKLGNGRRLAIRVEPEQVQAAEAALRSNALMQGASVKVENGWIHLDPGARPISAILKILESFQLSDMKIFEQNLEEVIHRFYTDLKGGGAVTAEPARVRA